MKSHILFSLFLIFFSFVSFSQTDVEKSRDYQDMGFDFFVAGGAYFGSSVTAEYYNGAPYNENNLDYILKNKYWYDEINLVIQENYPYAGDSIWVEDYPSQMRYKMAFSIALGLRYKFNKHWCFVLNNSFARLTATDIFLLHFPTIEGNLRNDYAMANIMGKEDRFLIDVGMGYTMHPNDRIKPFFELGIQFNYVKTKEFIAVFERGELNEREYNLLNQYQGSSYVPGMQTGATNVIWGGPGFGFSGVVGVKFIFNQDVSIDPMFYASMSRFGIEGYKQFCFNYGIFVRLTLSDKAFLKNRY